MTQPEPTPQSQPSVLARRIGPLPVLVWLLILVLGLVVFFVWRKRKAASGQGTTAGLAASDLDTSGAVISNPNLFSYPQSVYLYRDDDVPVPDANTDDGTSTPGPTTPTTPSPGGSTDPFESQRWFNRKVSYSKYTSQQGDDWFSVYDKFKNVILRNPDTNQPAGPWNLFLYNSGRLGMSQTDWPSSTVNDPNGKQIPAGTVIAIPIATPAGGFGPPAQARVKTMATTRSMSDLRSGVGQGFQTSPTAGRVIPQ